MTKKTINIKYMNLVFILLSNNNMPKPKQQYAPKRLGFQIIPVYLPEAIFGFKNTLNMITKKII